jgi:hypothetical protein
MRRFIRAALLGLAFVTIAGVFAVLAWFANEWVVSALASAAVLAWLAGWLAIFYGRDRVRAAAIGAVVAGAAYWLLALGPWFQANVGSTLLTSRLLAWVEATHRQSVHVANPNGVFTTIDLGSGYVPANTALGDIDLVTTTPYVVTTIPPVPQAPTGMSAFQLAGHWSLAWLFALAGGALASFLHRRADGSDSAGSGPATEEAAA